MKLVSVLFLLTVLFNNQIQCARILAYIPLPSRSHHIAFATLWKELSLRGHEVTLLTSYPSNDPKLTNLTEIDLHDSIQFWDRNWYKDFEHGLWYVMNMFIETSYKLMDNQLSHPKVKEIIEDANKHFDLVIIEGYHSSAFAFVHRFKCPFIAILSLDGTSFIHQELGNPSHPVLQPDYTLPFYGDLTFWNRLASTVNYIYTQFYNKICYIPVQQSLVKKHFGDNYPLIQDIFKNYSMFFINSNYVLHSIRALLPNVIQIGGRLHVTKRNPLPKNLQEILDKATNGAIYFSLGTNFKSSYLSDNTLKIILDSFKELPYTVLWKTDGSLIDSPDNVITAKWFPQQDVLHHPNVKLFITQGGLQSIEEAMFGGVPIIGMPTILDQLGNVGRIVSKGVGVIVDLKNITKANFKTAIIEVIKNPKYRNRIQELQELIEDQSETGLEKAIWWTEYVIRHKGAPHLRNPAHDLPWYTYYLLDVVGFCLFVFLFVTYILSKFIVMLTKLLRYGLHVSKSKIKMG